MAQEYGSLNNMILDNGAKRKDNKPVVGDGATILYWTDRHAYDVTWVSKDGKKCRLESEKHGTLELEFRYGRWKEFTTEVDFTKEMHAKYSQVRETSGLRRNEEIWQSIIGKETFEDIYQDHFLPIKVVKGITYEKKIYSNINVAFGFKDEYYDLEF